MFFSAETAVQVLFSQPTCTHLWPSSWKLMLTHIYAFQIQ